MYFDYFIYLYNIFIFLIIYIFFIIILYLLSFNYYHLLKLFQLLILSTIFLIIVIYNKATYEFSIPYYSIVTKNFKPLNVTFSFFNFVSFIIYIFYTYIFIYNLIYYIFFSTKILLITDKFFDRQMNLFKFKLSFSIFYFNFM